MQLRRCSSLYRKEAQYKRVHRPALSNPYSESLATAADIVVLIFFLFALDTQLRKLYRYRRSGIGKLGCGDVWVVIEHSSTVAVVAFCFVWISILLLIGFSGATWLLSLSAGRIGHLMPRLEIGCPLGLTNSRRWLNSPWRCVSSSRLPFSCSGCGYWRYSASIQKLSILTRTVASALHQFGVFFIVFVVIFATFAVSGAILFGDRVEEFSSLETATETCINMLFANFDYNSNQGLYALVCKFYYRGYMIGVSLMLLNLMLAIVLDAYAQVSSESYKSQYNLAVGTGDKRLLFRIRLRDY